MRNEINIKEMVNKRKVRGMLLLEKGIEPKEVKPLVWIVPSQTGKKAYTIRKVWGNNHWLCSCPDYKHMGLPCKHIIAVKIWKNLKDKFEQLHLKIKQNIEINDTYVECCKFCQSQKIIKYGKQNGK
jgi:predicted nucleic acid-binding Zn finger protein